MAMEIELKLLATPRVLALALREPWLRDLATAKPHKEELVSVYFDTPNCDLRRHHMALRVRHIGEKRLQTVKAAVNGSLGSPERGEWEQEIGQDSPDPELVSRTPAGSVLSRKERSALRPVFETAVERTVLNLRFRQSDIELAVDRGWIGAAGKRERIGEIEIELKRGKPADLAKLAAQMATAFPVSYGVLAKSERGYALSSGTSEAPVRASEICLAKASTCAAAFVAIGQSCLYHFAANAGAVANGDAEGIHQMRVGLRRLRAAVSVFKHMLAGRETEDIKAELKWLSDRLAPARNFDVFLREVIAPVRDQTPDSREIAALERDLQQRREQAFSEAGKIVDNPRYRALLLRTALWLFAGEWSETGDALARARREAPARPFAGAALQKRTKMIVKTSRKLAKLDPRRRHKLRISVKKLRYATEFFAGLFDRRKKAAARRHFEGAVRPLQHVLGKLNDIATHDRLAHELSMAGPGKSCSVAEAFAIGYLTSREQKKVRGCLKRADRAARKLSDAKPFWR